MLKVEKLNVYYGNIHALKEISFEVQKGEIVTLIGANGAGKTSTLQAISGMIKASSGAITLKGNIEKMYKRFPRLKERRKQLAGTMSGGEQQMLAMARALMSRPEMILMDEPSMGLAPILVQEIFEIIKEINADGTTVLLV